MFTRFCFLMAATGFAVIVLLVAIDAVSEQAGGPILEVAASYPGANAQVVAETLAAPVEQQINGVEGMVRIVSTSGPNGKYAALIYFKPNTDPEIARVLVENRVSLAAPVLPDAVQKNQVSVKLWKTEPKPNEVAIAVIDRQVRGWEELQRAASAAMKRLEADGAIMNPQMFPRDEKRVSVEPDRAKCLALGVPVADVSKAAQAAGTTAKIEDLRNLMVRDKISLKEVATIKEVTEPSAIYQVNLHLAIRIIGAPPAGKSVAASAARCVALAEDEINRFESGAFTVENLSEK